MGFYFRRSMKILPGVRLNFSKNGIGASFGGRGARYSISPTGRETFTTGIPGTGISYRQNMNPKRSPRTRERFLTPNAQIESSRPESHPFLGGIAALFAIGFVSSAVTNYTDKNKISVGDIIGAIIALGLSIIFLAMGHIRQDDTELAKLDNIENSRFMRDPLDLAEWQQTEKDLSELIDLLTKSQLQVTDNSIDITFPVKANEVLIGKFHGAISDGEGIEMSEAGTIFVTDKRITFISQSETEEWKYDNMGSPTIYTVDHIVTFPLTNRKKVTGVIILNDDWGKFMFFMNAAIATTRIGTSALNNFKAHYDEYLKRKPVTS